MINPWASCPNQVRHQDAPTYVAGLLKDSPLGLSCISHKTIGSQQWKTNKSLFSWNSFWTGSCRTVLTTYTALLQTTQRGIWMHISTGCLHVVGQFSSLNSVSTEAGGAVDTKWGRVERSKTRFASPKKSWLHLYGFVLLGLWFRKMAEYIFELCPSNTWRII